MLFKQWQTAILSEELTTPTGKPRTGGPAFKRLRAAGKRWRIANALVLVALDNAGVQFPDGRAEKSQSELAPADLLTRTLSVFAASEGGSPQDLKISRKSDRGC
jgi:hypothetical protein